MPVLPVNKGGGSGAEALRYMLDKSGDPHVIMATLNSYYTTPLRTDIGVDIEEFTPLGRMALDTFVLWVASDSGIETLDQYVAAVKDAGGSFKMGGTGTGQEDSLVTAMIEDTFDVTAHLRAVRGRRRRGQGAWSAATWTRASTTPPRPWASGRPTGCGRSRRSRPERLDIMPDVPTMTELGHDLTYTMQRSFVAAPGIPPEADGLLHDDARRSSTPQRSGRPTPRNRP